MASLTYKSGRALIQWVDAHGKRRSLRYADSRRGAEQTTGHVEKLSVASVSKTAMPRETAIWLADIGDKLHAKLAASGLVAEKAERETSSVELDAYFKAYIERRTDLKERSISCFEQVRTHIVKHFGPRQDITLINKAEMKDWHRYLKVTAELSGPTIAMHVKRAKQVFEDAVDRRIITENPLRKMKAGSQANEARMVYVPESDIEQVIAACPDDEWKLIFALARYGGVRVPSEPLGLRWSDVDWKTLRFTVRSPKTERHEGKDKRVVPIFPQLMPYLLKCFEAREDDEVRVIAKHRGSNLRTQADRIIERAGLKVWEKPFQNLRSSRETDLADQFPIQVVCEWIGNSVDIARKHYLQVKEMHYEQATVKSAALGAAAPCGTGRNAEGLNDENPRKSEGFASQYYPQGGANKPAILSGFPQYSRKALHGALRRLRNASESAYRAERARLRRERGRR